MRISKSMIFLAICISFLIVLVGLTWSTFFQLKEQLLSISPNAYYVSLDTLRLLGAIIIITFIFLFLLLVIPPFFSRDSYGLQKSIKTMEVIESKRTPITKFASSIGVMLEEQRRMEEELRTRHDWLSRTLQSIGHAVITTDPQGKINFINPVAEQLTGWKIKEAIGNGLSTVFQTSRDSNGSPETSNTLLARKTRIYQGILRTKNGDLVAIDSSVAPIKSSNGNGARVGFVLVFRDITKEKKKEQKIKYQANFDELTGLANRRFLVEQFIKSSQASDTEGKDLAVLFIDLDRFKSVNDTLGHELGDLLLKKVANRLKDLVGKNDTVARLAGDEFVLILPDIDTQEIILFSERLLAKMREPYNIRGQRLVITPSVGISIYPEQGRTLDALLNKADQAMYLAKQEGKNSFRLYK